MKRRIAVLIGSQSDLKQCGEGLKILKSAVEEEIVEVVDLRASSIHRAMTLTLAHVRDKADIDVMITGAGWANHLTGVTDAYLRYALENTKVVVIGVAFEDAKNPKHTQAAILSITEVPGTQVVFEDAEGEFSGPDGFRRACQFAVSGELPVLTIPEERPPVRFTLDEAIAIANSQ